MRRRIVWVILGAPLALIVMGAGAALSVPAIRHAISGIWNLPDRLPALPGNSQVHYQPGAEDFARDVAALLPDAVTRVEAAHGRRFAHPVKVAVYATPEAFVIANGVGSDMPRGGTFLGRVNLSPKLFWPERPRLSAILTHELSHAHIQWWIGVGYIYLPRWFKEGLAVTVSGGGGAEAVSEEEARAAIQRGEHITIDDAEGLQDLLAGFRFDRAPATTTPSWYPVVLAYRQAGMFVSYLRESDGPAFDRMMSAILDGRAFAEAVDVGYHDDVRSLWRQFVKSSADRK
jgi:hypothetical protein